MSEVDINLYAELFPDDIIIAWEKYLEVNGARLAFERFINKNDDAISGAISSLLNAELQRLKTEENLAKAKFYSLAEEYA